MVGFEPFGMGFGMILIWLIPVLLVALVIAGMKNSSAKLGTSWKHDMHAVKSIGMNS